MSIILGWVPQPIAGAQVVQQPFFDSVYRLLQEDARDRQEVTGYTHASCGYIPASRNVLMEKFLESTAEWMLMLDWDVTFTTQDVYTLLDAADPVRRPIIGGTYVTYMGPENLLRPCWLALPQTEDGFGYHPVNEFEVGRIYELATVGMGFTLIHRSVGEAMEKAHADDPWHWFGHDQINESRTGEDLTFCSRARALGFKSFGHGGVLLGHTKACELHPADMHDPTRARAQHPREGAPASERPRVLNVGGGSKSIPIPLHYQGCEHVLLDIAEGPDVDLVMDAKELREHGELLGQFDAVYCSHNLEHFHGHEVPVVLDGFYNVLKKDGTVEIHVPNMQQVVEDLANGSQLDDIAYESAAGPIMYRDMMFGYSREIEESGNDFYAHKTAFTEARLNKVLEAAGFVDVQTFTDEHFNLAATARKG